MSDDSSFRDLLAGVRTGRPEAAQHLIHRYEPSLRRVIEVRLRDPRLRRQIDVDDVCQSVLFSFFVRASLGQYELSGPDDLLRLLATMARNKLANLAKYHRAGRRDARRVEGAPVEECGVATGEATPSQQVSAAELQQEAYRRLSAEERQLVDLRQKGRTWVEIAAELGGTPDALRNKLTRAAARIAEQLGLDEEAA